MTSCRLCMFENVYVSMCVCVYVCVYVCVNRVMHVSLHVYTYPYMHVCMHVCMCAYVHVNMHVCLYVSLYVFMHLCMYVFTSSRDRQQQSKRGVILGENTPFFSHRKERNIARECKNVNIDDIACVFVHFF